MDRPVILRRSQRMIDGRLGPPLLLVPEARRPVELSNLLGGPLPDQPLSQRLRKEVVVPVPLTLMIQGDHEQVPLLQPLQHGLTIVLTGDRVAQGAAQPVQHGGLKEKTLHLLCLKLQYLLHQVVQDILMTAGERFHKPVDICEALQREPRQLKPGDPPLRPSRQQGDLPVGQLKAHHTTEEGSRLRLGKPQLLQAHLHHLTADP